VRRYHPKDYIEQDAVIDGQRTGLWLPRKRPEVYPSVSTEIKIMDTVTANRLIQSPERTPARERFPAKTWIRNQGGRGSCTGYGTAGVFSRVRVMLGLPFVMLAGEFIYSMINGGRDRGSPLEAAWEKIEEVGAAPESMVQHESYLWKSMSAEAKSAAANFRGFECFRIDSEMELVSSILSNFLVVACVHVSRSYKSLDSRGVRGASSGGGNHCIGIQDVFLSPDGEYELDEIGSWGLGNGQNGYARLTFKRHLRSTIQRHAFYAIRGASGPI